MHVAGSTPAPKAITLAVAPRVCFEPCEVRVRLSIEPDDRNRGFCLSLEGTLSYPNSCMPLDGANAAKTREIWYHGLPGGDYTLLAQIGRADGSVERTPPFTIQILSSR